MLCHLALLESANFIILHSNPNIINVCLHRKQEDVGSRSYHEESEGAMDNASTEHQAIPSSKRCKDGIGRAATQRCVHATSFVVSDNSPYIVIGFAWHAIKVTNLQNLVVYKVHALNVFLIPRQVWDCMALEGSQNKEFTIHKPFVGRVRRSSWHKIRHWHEVMTIDDSMI